MLLPASELYKLRCLFFKPNNRWNFTPFNKPHRVPRPMVTTVAMEGMPSGFTITSKITRSYRLPFILTHPAAALVQHALHKIKLTTSLKQVISLVTFIVLIRPLTLLRRMIGRPAFIRMDLNLLLLMHPRRFSSNTQEA
jgi:hypothetical protein